MGLFDRLRATERTTTPGRAAATDCGPLWRYSPPSLAESRWLVMEEAHRDDSDPTNLDAFMSYRRMRPGYRNLLDDQGALLTPEGTSFSVTDGAFHRASGLLALAGSGRAVEAGESREGVFLGRLGGGRLIPTADGLANGVHPDIWAMDISPVGDRVALLEWTGTGRVSLVDVSTGERRVVTWLDQSTEPIFGINEIVRFSPDGAWLLLFPWLIEVETGRLVQLPLDRRRDRAAWWDARSPSSLVTWHWHQDGTTSLGFLDLHTEEAGHLGPIRLPRARVARPTGAEMTDALLGLVQQVEVAADGHTVLIQSNLGLDPSGRPALGRRPRFALGRLLDPTSGPAAEITDVRPGILDANGTAEIEQKRARFIDRPSRGPTVIAPTFLVGARDAYLTDPHG